MKRQKQAEAVHQRLLEHYGRPDWHGELSPVEELVSTILSQNTNDVNRDRAYDRLVSSFDSWEEVRDAEQDEVIEAIRVAGLANQKGPRIQEALRTITRKQGEITLDFLEEMDPESARKWLEDLKGVGPKTASIVLLFAFQKPAFPVDTHVHRVTTRLGLIPEGTTAEKAHKFLASLFDEGAYHDVHLNIITLGREICQARKPLCAQCPLTDLCRYYQENVKNEQKT